MGFPEWTLWGMGLAATGALLIQTLALLGQSPALLRRLRLTGTGLERRVRALTGYALALLILAMGFFLAGVPLESSSNPDTALASDASEVEAAARLTGDAQADVSETSNTLSLETTDVTPATPETGAFSGPPPTRQISQPEATLTPTNPVTSTASVEIIPTTRTANTPAPDTSETGTTTPRPTNSPTSTPTPTATPTPTLTPTPVTGRTAVLSTNGATMWLKRSPGGLNLVLLPDRATVLLSDGHANYAGELWQEVITLEGVTGWILDEFLEYPD